MTFNVLVVLAIIAGILAAIELFRAPSLGLVAVLLIAIGIIVEFGVVK